MEGKGGGPGTKTRGMVSTLAGRWPGNLLGLVTSPLSSRSLIFFLLPPYSSLELCGVLASLS